MKYFFLIFTLSVNKMHLLLRIHKIDELNRFFKIGLYLVISTVHYSEI
jgi:hypothetical protein